MGRCGRQGGGDGLLLPVALTLAVTLSAIDLAFRGMIRAAILRLLPSRAVRLSGAASLPKADISTSCKTGCNHHHRYYRKRKGIHIHVD